ncbi:MAG TPA: ABC transporter substrate-binding protein [Bradyrhizobium sp.]|jgi:ABC-type nitrate/sulfonate/bicarbonate transport system substrate-binding protein|nr:ABC transporter substrate-binding protein [Bradyrhizobium sp.]
MRFHNSMINLLAIGTVLMLMPAPASAQQTVRIAQGVSTLSFLPVWAARALNTFAAQGLTANAVVVPGGDAAALAALDAGDIDLAAVGSETVLRAAAKGQPFQIVYSLMSKVTIQLVVSPALLERTGVRAGDPLEKRLGALKGATVGVAAVGGTQDAAARWLAAKGGLNPKADIKVAQIGNPVALQAALENKQIDAFVLSPPEGFLAEKSGSGIILASLGDDFPILNHQPYLVLVAKKPIDDQKAMLFVKTARALQAASDELVKQPDQTAQAIHRQFFPKATPESMIAAVKAMNSGVADGGHLDVEGFSNTLTFAREIGTNFGKDFDAKAAENDLWTNRFVDGARAK